jgi:putative colanic acid biosynthesis UDP-glucose lipid carrier transferase
MSIFGESFGLNYQILMVFAALLTLLFFRDIGFVKDTFSPSSIWSSSGSVIWRWIGLIGLLLLVGYATKTSEIYSRRVLFTWFLIAPPAIILAVAFFDRALSPIARSANQSRRAVIAGVNEIGVALAERLASSDRLGMTLLGFFDDRNPERLGAIKHGRLLGRLNELPALVKQGGADVIFLALPIKNVKRVTELLDELHDTTVSIYFLPDIFVFDLIQCRTTDIGGLPAVALCETPFYGPSGIIKRASDICIATLALIIFSPLMLAVALAVKLTSPGRVIFKQRRYGLDGREIIVYKFRSMRTTDDGKEILQARMNDPRITSIGKILRRYSLDELPQFINVIQGCMSVVGPRPHAIAHNEEYRSLIKGYMLRHKVRPGITGLAQINGLRGETRTVEDMRRRVQYDLDYLRHWSLGLDAKIIFKTITMVFRDPNAY